MAVRRKAVRGYSAARQQLTDQHAFFCEEYIKDFNGKQAALRAGYTKSTAEQVNRSLMTKPAQEYIDELLAVRTHRLRVDADEVLLRILEMIDLDPNEILDENGAMLEMQHWPPHWRRGITEFTIKERNVSEDGKVVGTVTRVKLPDRVKLLEMLGKHINVQAWNERSTTEVNMSGIDQLHALRLGQPDGFETDDEEEAERGEQD